MADWEGAGHLRRRGLRLMDPHLAVQALGQVLDGGEGPVAVADVDWARFAPVFTAARPCPLFAALPEVRALTATPDAPPAGASPLARQLAAAGVPVPPVCQAEVEAGHPQRGALAHRPPSVRQ